MIRSRRYGFFTQSFRALAIFARMLAVFQVGVCFAPSAFADPVGAAYVMFDIRDGIVNGVNNEQTSQGQAPGSYSDSLSALGGTASASGNLPTGTLKAGATSPAYGGANTGLYYAYAQARIGDNVTFSSNASGTAYVDYHWDGTISGFGGLQSSNAGLEVIIANADGAAYTVFALDNYSCASYTLPSSSSTCTAGTSIDQAGSIPFDILPGTTYIEMILTAYPSDGGTANFMDTGSFDLRLPDGVTYTSSSGEFLVDAAPIFGSAPNGVPEPETAALMSLGFALISVSLGMRRRRIATDPDQTCSAASAFASRA